MKMKIMTAIFAVAAAAPVLADTYDIDASHTTFGFGVKHMVVSTVRGSFGDFKGEFAFDPAKPEATKASAVIQIKSVTTANQKRDDHLKGKDFFDAEKFPEMKFESSSVEKSGDGLVMKGKLTIKETTKDVSIPVTISGPIQDPWGNQRAGIEGSLKINRKDYGLNFNAAMANGGLVVADEVAIDISIEGIKRK